MIPAEACAKRNFMVWIVGKSPDGVKIMTNAYMVSQTGGAV